MTRVALVTNWDEHCAVAEYASNLWDQLSSRIEFNIIHEITEESVFENSIDCDVIHYNYCSHAFKNWKPTSWFKMRDIPKILTFHESSDWQTRRLADSGIADLYIVHDKLRDGLPKPSNVETIPFGVPEAVGLSEWFTPGDVGTFGCAFPWKALLPLAAACEKNGLRLRAYISEASAEDCKVDFDSLKKKIWEIHPRALIQASWGAQDTIIHELSSCQVIALPFDPAAPINGISASVRFALAAKRPLVLTRFHHYSDLYDYDKSIYFVEQNCNLDDALGCAMEQNAKIPIAAYEAMTWTKAARAYESIYKSIRFVEEHGKSLTAR